MLSMSALAGGKLYRLTMWTKHRIAKKRKNGAGLRIGQIALRSLSHAQVPNTTIQWRAVAILMIGMISSDPGVRSQNASHTIV